MSHVRPKIWVKDQVWDKAACRCSPPVRIKQRLARECDFVPMLLSLFGGVRSLRIRQALSAVPLTTALLLCFAASALYARHSKKQAAEGGPGESAVLSRMDGAARDVRTVSTHLAYTTVTVLVNDRSTQAGVMYYRKGRHWPEVLIHFEKPAIKVILFRRNRAEIYYPSMKQLQEYSLEHHQNVLQQYLLLGFGTQSQELERSFRLRFLGEQDLGGAKTSLIELVPLNANVSAQLKKVDLWLSDETWLPVQQQFFEASGDYLIARYSDMKVNQAFSASTFKIELEPGVERVKMN
jgi:outer membrane lipoprotein-sorting protein